MMHHAPGYAHEVLGSDGVDVLAVAARREVDASVEVALAVAVETVLVLSATLLSFFVHAPMKSAAATRASEVVDRQSVVLM